MRKLKGHKHRVETGALQFGDDWPGLFIRGNDCIQYASMLRFASRVLRENNKPIIPNRLEELADIIENDVLIK
jgi:hypothetical protein